jgi:hypothetical protein
LQYPVAEDVRLLLRGKRRKKESSTRRRRLTLQKSNDRKEDLEQAVRQATGEG